MPAARRKATKSTEDKKAVLNQADVVRFEKAARAFTKRAAESKASARTELKAIGIITPSGKLSARYR